MFGFIWFNKFVEKDYNMKKVMMRREGMTLYMLLEAHMSFGQTEVS